MQEHFLKYDGMDGKSCCKVTKKCRSLGLSTEKSYFCTIKGKLRYANENNNIFYHLVAFLTVAIWGTTFVSTKVLMLNGLSPAQIFTLRFSIAYVLMLAFNHRRLFADSWQDEAKMALLGITGGSLYFCSENEAMNFTTTTNTSLIVCSCPLFATLLVRLVYKDSNRIHIVQLLGSLLAFVGMIIVVLNGRFVLHLSPVGDALAFTACMCWAIYSLLMKSTTGDYSPAFITRKVFSMVFSPSCLIISSFRVFLRSRYSPVRRYSAICSFWAALPL